MLTLLTSVLDYFGDPSDPSQEFDPGEEDDPGDEIADDEGFVTHDN